MKKLLSVSGEAFGALFLRFYFEKRKSIATQFDVRPSMRGERFPSAKLLWVVGEKSPSSALQQFSIKLSFEVEKSTWQQQRERELRESFESQTTVPFFRTKQMFPPLFPSRASRPKRWW